LPLDTANTCATGAEHSTLKGGKLGSNRLIIRSGCAWLEGEAQPGRTLTWGQRCSSEEVEELNGGGSRNALSCDINDVTHGGRGGDEERNIARYWWRCRWQRHLRNVKAPRPKAGDRHLSEQDARLITPGRRCGMELSEEARESVTGNPRVDARMKHCRVD
jgi:hypothetical protein